MVPSFFVNAGLAKIGAASTAMISNVSPLMTIYFAVVLLGEHFTWTHAVGTALVVGGVGLNTWSDLKAPTENVAAFPHPPRYRSAPSPRGGMFLSSLAQRGGGSAKR